MSISIRPEQKKDFRAVEELTREAFWDLYKPGCDEHFIVHKMRDIPACIQELDFVACDENDTIIGNIMYSKAKIINDENKEFEVLCMGPLAVLPSYQKQGIGTLLMKHSIEQAKKLGYKAIIIFGDPDYYHRFGFANAETYHIQTAEGTNFEPFMALELYEDSLAGISGKFYADKVFETEEKELETFEKGFPYKEKHITDTQLKI
jgi:predicted N-acetyltransferase YhbS